MKVLEADAPCRSSIPMKIFEKCGIRQTREKILILHKVDTGIIFNIKEFNCIIRHLNDSFRIGILL